MKMLEHWLPPDDAGDPMACLATTFTFDTDFFAEDCLSRFLGISGRDPDGATGFDIAGLLEEEERLAEARVSVLVDQSCRPEPRNLRWDLVPIRVPGGLLHAKVAVLIWQRAARVLIGSANLTRAGYRRQVEACTALDLDAECRVPRAVFNDLASELRSLVDLAPGNRDRLGPVRRAHEIIDLFAARVDSVSPPVSAPAGVRFTLAAGRVGSRPLDRLDDVWSGSPPQSVVALSPFWDDSDAMPGARAVLDRLAKRASTGERTRATFVVPVDSILGQRVVRAPAKLRHIAERRIESSVVAFKGNDDRRLHAKCVQYRSATWMATMIGSSNLTGKGLGLVPASHREINLWIGCRVNSSEAKALGNLVPQGDEVNAETEWNATADEDEVELHPLPVGFGEALVTSPRTIELSFTGATLPGTWHVVMTPPGGGPIVLFDTEQYLAAGSPASVSLQLSDDLEALPSLLDVSWTHHGEQRTAAWFVNVGDGSALPPPAELRLLSVDVLLAVLASTRPLRSAVEEALRREHHKARTTASDELDPLKRFDSSGFLLQRTKRSSAALWGIERRLNLPLHSLEALEWRLAGTLGPEHIAARLVEAASTDRALAGEAHFLLAELALTVRRVPWATVRGELALDVVRARVDQAITSIRTSADQLDHVAVHQSIIDYVSAAFDEATR
jgi:hypothetical protein